MGLFNNLKSEPVSALNLRSPVCVAPNETLSDVVRTLREARLGCAIVVDDKQRPIGLMTENMLTKLVARKPEAIKDPVKDHVAERFPKVLESDPIAIVLDALQTHNTRFLVVVNDADEVVGLTGQKGLMEFVAEHFNQVAVQSVGLATAKTNREGA